MSLLDRRGRGPVPCLFSFLRQVFITRTLPTVAVADATPILTVKNRAIAAAHCALQDSLRHVCELRRNDNNSFNLRLFIRYHRIK